MPGASTEAAKVQVHAPLGSHEASPQKGAQGLSPMSFFRKTALRSTVQDRWVLWCHWAAMQSGTSKSRVEKARRAINDRAEGIDSDEDLFMSPLKPAKAHRRPERPALFQDRTQTPSAEDRTQKPSAEPIAALPERNDADAKDDQLPIANTTIVAPEFQARPNRSIAATQGPAEPLELRSPADGKPRCYCCSSCDSYYLHCHISFLAASKAIPWSAAIPLSLSVPASINQYLRDYQQQGALVSRACRSP